MSDKFSFSRLDTYDGTHSGCPFKYWLIYDQKHFVNTESVATAIGTLIHETEESIAKCLRDNLPVDYTQLKNNLYNKLEELRAKFPDTFDVPDKAGKTYMEKINYYTTYTIYNLEMVMREHPSYKIVGIEDDFEFELNNHEFKGFIDRFFYDTATDTYIIQDIKTWYAPKEDKDLVTPLQFVIYAIALNKKYNCSYDKRVCQYYLPFLNMTQNAGTDGFINRGIKKITKLLDGIEAGEWEPSPKALCAWCQFSITNKEAPEETKYLCPYHSLWTNEFKTKNTACMWLGMENHQAILEDYQKHVKKEGGEL